ncbi:hypothetical protein CEXT_807721 [Caerostris extrusa]|uniref:Uncharacterized protein n=1 Tax=Caerostris extrusa TaxID=172846 RepID=A0AAV4V691_CAEEX|nr:hypothetical protein CEXT_807721 [Caerostris extrusa]
MNPQAADPIRSREEQTSGGTLELRSPATRERLLNLAPRWPPDERSRAFTQTESGELIVGKRFRNRAKFVALSAYRHRCLLFTVQSWKENIQRDTLIFKKKKKVKKLFR